MKHITQAMNIGICMTNTTIRIGVLGAATSMKTRANELTINVIEFKNGNTGETIRVT